MNLKKIIDKAIHEQSGIGVIIVSIILLSISYFFGITTREIIIFILAIITCYLSNRMLKKVFKKKRPRNTKQTMDYSFPSNHTQMSAFLIVFFTIKAPITMIITLPILSALIYHRLINKHHRIEDIIGGIFFGTIFGLAGLL